MDNYHLKARFQMKCHRERGRRIEMKRSALVVVLILTLTATAFAGSTWLLKCQDPKCKYEGSIQFGGGFHFREVTGYCTTCREIVSIYWTRPNKKRPNKKGGSNGSQGHPETHKAPPNKLGTIWNPATGRTADLYPCPKCTNTFMEINGSDFQTVKSEIMFTFELLWDKHSSNNKNSKESRMDLLNELVKHPKMFCPHCTQLSLKVDDGGRSD
jgi:Zn finger protein HypA/HybF involved in hydrogenase expression